MQLTRRGFGVLTIGAAAIAGGLRPAMAANGLDEAIAAFTGTMSRVGAFTDHLDETLAPLSASISETAESARTLIRNTDGHMTAVASAIGAAAGDAGKLARDAQTLVREIDSGLRPILATLREASRKADTVLAQAESTMATLERQLDDDSPLLFELSQTFKELSAASRSIRIMADYIERHPEALLKGKGGFKGLQELRR